MIEATDDFPAFDESQRPTADEHGRQIAPETFVRWLAPACWEDAAGAAHFDVPLLHRWLGLPTGTLSIEETADMLGAMLKQLYAQEDEPPPRVIVRNERKSEPVVVSTREPGGESFQNNQPVGP